MFGLNPRLDMPELLYPGRKPVGNVKIDHNNSLADGLIGYWLCQEKALGLNLVDGVVLPKTGSAMAEPNGIDGLGLKGDGSTYLTSLDDKFNIAGDFTLFALIRLESVVGFSTYIGKGDKQFELRRRTDGIDFVVRVASAWSEFRVTGYSTGDLFFVVATVLKETQTLYINNINKGSRSVTPVASAQDFRVFGNSEMPGRNLRDTVYCIGIYNRGMASEEATRLTSDPYQFLIPA